MRKRNILVQECLASYTSLAASAILARSAGASYPIVPFAHAHNIDRHFHPNFENTVHVGILCTLLHKLCDLCLLMGAKN